jgi:DNA-directed RNA polymerase subunit M
MCEKQRPLEKHVVVNMLCECGGMIVGAKGKTICRSCGKEYTEKVELRSVKKEKESAVVIENNAPNLATTEKECPKCFSSEAYFALIQTRSMDEPPTQFYKCKSCSHVWREYK